VTEVPEGHYRLTCPYNCGWAVVAPLDVKDAKGGHVDVTTPQPVQDTINEHLVKVHGHPKGMR
jgi:hypothetical protein